MCDFCLLVLGVGLVWVFCVFLVVGEHIQGNRFGGDLMKLEATPLQLGFYRLNFGSLE